MLQLARPLPAVSVYHTQQTGEKALKAFLAAYNTPFRPTHNLQELLALCVRLDAQFGQFRFEAALTPYATQFRYPIPGVPREPPAQSAQPAIVAADRILSFVHQHLRL